MTPRTVRFLNDPPDRYSYSSHYCTVDDPRNATLVVFGFRESAGLRVFDIHDPVHPKEIAHYKPLARRRVFLPGSVFWRDSGGGDRTTDQVPSSIRFRKHRGELWLTGADNGFQIVRFTNGVGPPRCFGARFSANIRRHRDRLPRAWTESKGGRRGQVGRERGSKAQQGASETAQ